MLIKQLILDYNGVISNDFELVHAAVMVVFTKNGLQPISLESFRNEFFLPAAFYWQKKLPTVSFEYIREIYHQSYQQLGPPKPYLNAKKTLEYLHNRGVELYILSAHRSESIFNELDSFDINKGIFSNIYAGVKNKLEVIEQIVVENSIDSTQAAYVGDSEHDIQAAKRVKITSIASTFGYRTKLQLKSADPDLFINDISELIELVSS